MERFFLNSQVEFQASESDDSPGMLLGYFTKYNILSNDLGGYRRVLRPGLFGDTWKQTEPVDVKAFYDHNTTDYLGRSSLPNSLTLGMDDIGGRAKLKLPNTQLGRDVAWLAGKNPDGVNHFRGWSFGMDAGPEDYRIVEEAGGIIVEFFNGILREVSLVHDPAIPFTTMELYSLTEPSDELKRAVEEFQIQKARTPRRNMAEKVLQILTLPL